MLVMLFVFPPIMMRIKKRRIGAAKEKLITSLSCTEMIVSLAYLKEYFIPS